MSKTLATPKMYEHLRGIRGCCQWVKRHGNERFCAQLAIVWQGRKGYCWYHNPSNPHPFGVGYNQLASREREAIP